MKIVVTTCDEYSWLIPEMVDRLNRYWPWNEVDVLGYEKWPKEWTIDKPSNVRCISLGVQPPNEDWTTGLIPYFLRMWQEDSERAFVLMMDDYYLTGPCDLTLAKIQCHQIRDWDKFDLTRDRIHFPHFPLLTNGELDPWHDLVEDVVVSSQTARYRTSLKAAVWRVGYFLKYLKAGRTPWEFELLGENEAMNDGAVILGTTKGIVQYDNIMLKGERKKVAPC